jgi:mersacidin/lichenicidin family type 2 lantibiotic
MTPSDSIRAWKDPNYRAGLPATQRAQLPAHPAGAIELPEPTLHAARPHQGFRVKSGIRAGAPTNQQINCSAYGDNLWQDDLPRQ